MTKAFLEPIVLKPENESLGRKAFSKESLEIAKRHIAHKRTSLKSMKGRI